MFDPSKDDALSRVGDDALSRVGDEVVNGAYGAYNFNFVSDIYYDEVDMTYIINMHLCCRFLKFKLHFLEFFVFLRNQPISQLPDVAQKPFNT